MEFQANLKYPEIRVESKNKYYAYLLMEDYAGVYGELSAITQYVYQGFYNFKKYQEFSSIMEKIAMVEMHHLKLLGETINLLGVKPKFKTKDKDCFNLFWNSTYINYDTYMIKMLEADILSEEEAILNYKYHISIIDDIYIKELLERIILDEEIHLKIFKTLLNQYLNTF